MSSYSDLILAHASLRWYARLGEGSGTTLDDIGPNNLDGTYAATGITYGVAGAIANDANTAVTFAGSSDAAVVPHNSALDLGDGPPGFSIEFWVKRSATQGAIQQLICKFTNSYSVRFQAANTIVLLKFGVAGAVTTAGGAITDTTTWHHVVFTKNGSARAAYVDGADVTSLGTNQTLANNGTDLAIGQNAGTQRFPGSMDEIAIYGAVLTPDEVLQHYRTGRAQIQLTESVTSSDSRASAPQTVQADTATVSDTRVSATGKTQADTITASDATALAPGIALSDIASVSDALTSAEGNFVSLGDSVTVSDQVSPDLLEQFTQSVGDSVLVADSVVAAISSVSGTPPSPGGGILVPVIRTVKTEGHRLHFHDPVFVTDNVFTDRRLADIARDEELALALA